MKIYEHHYDQDTGLTDSPSVNCMMYIQIYYSVKEELLFRIIYPEDMDFPLAMYVMCQQNRHWLVFHISSPFLDNQTELSVFGQPKISLKSAVMSFMIICLYQI